MEDLKSVLDAVYCKLEERVGSATAERQMSALYKILAAGTLSRDQYAMLGRLSKRQVVSVVRRLIKADGSDNLLAHYLCSYLAKAAKAVNNTYEYGGCRMRYPKLCCVYAYKERDGSGYEVSFYDETKDQEICSVAAIDKVAAENLMSAFVKNAPRGVTCISYSFVN